MRLIISFDAFTLPCIISDDHAPRTQPAAHAPTPCTCEPTSTSNVHLTYMHVRINHLISCLKTMVKEATIFRHFRTEKGLQLKNTATSRPEETTTTCW